MDRSKKLTNLVIQSLIYFSKKEIVIKINDIIIITIPIIVVRSSVPSISREPQKSIKSPFPKLLRIYGKFYSAFSYGISHSMILVANTKNPILWAITRMSNDIMKNDIIVITNNIIAEVNINPFVKNFNAFVSAILLI